MFVWTDPDQGLRDGVRQRHHVLQGGRRYEGCSERGRLQRVREAAGSHNAEERAGDEEPRGHPLRERVHRS